MHGIWVASLTRADEDKSVDTSEEGRVSGGANVVTEALPGRLARVRKLWRSSGLVGNNLWRKLRFCCCIRIVEPPFSGDAATYETAWLWWGNTTVAISTILLLTTLGEQPNTSFFIHHYSHE